MKTAIAQALMKIIQEPLIYFSEADVQQIICDSIKSIPAYGKLYPTSVNKGKDSKTVYKTSLVHREYGGGQGRRIDLVVFNKDDVLKIDSPALTINGKYITPQVAIEIGTEKTSDALTHMKNDIAKLKRCKDGYLIHIYKDSTQAKSGTLSRQRTEEKIKKKFKDVFVADPKIKIIAILLRTYRNQTKMRGKCEIFNKGNWEKININDKKKIEAKLMEVMR